ncbi:MAG TPA: hypothetical protein VGC37_09775 [Friedmanniella sp.]
MGVLLADARTSASALEAFYAATAPRLAFALSATQDQRLAEDVLVRTYRQVWATPASERVALADDRAVMAWLTRVALVELVTIRRPGAGRSPGDAGGPLTLV